MADIDMTKIVMKFGGVSIADESCIRHVIRIIQQRVENNPILVFSAMSKTTRRLLQVAEWQTQGIGESSEGLLEIETFHRALAQQLIPDWDESEYGIRFDSIMSELHHAIQSLPQTDRLEPKLQDRILPFGELLSTIIMSAVLQQAGVRAKWLDIRNAIITNEDFTMAMPIPDISSVKINEQVGGAVEAGYVPVIQGFIGSTEKGDSTTLGFEGSDFTATLVGSSLKASEIQIWKDVPGLMTADPRVIEEARKVDLISFEEAAELSFFGAKVLHPNTIEPARAHQIPIYINNVRDPDKPGTKISSDLDSAAPIVKSITAKHGMQAIQMKPFESPSNYVFLDKVFDALDEADVMPYAFQSEPSGISLVISAGDENSELNNNLDFIGEKHVSTGHSTLTLVGEKIRTFPDFKSMVLKLLKGFHIKLVSDMSSPISLTFMINTTDVDAILKHLHEKLIIQQAIEEAT
ncbi:hypothetical protein BVY01_03380 [bacterium I07]|nr:hypothetical protein BVY01_03380 [bacterium I07]